MSDVKTIDTSVKEVNYGFGVPEEEEATKHIRVPIPKPKRSKIIKEQKYRCGICDSRILGGNFDVDHLVPVALGGTNHSLNLLAICPTCHGLKSRMVDRNLRFLDVTNVKSEEEREQIIKYVRASLDYAHFVSHMRDS